MPDVYANSVIANIYGAIVNIINAIVNVRSAIANIGNTIANINIVDVLNNRPVLLNTIAK